MFLGPLTLQNITHLRHPSERVLLAEKDSYEEGLHLIEEDRFVECARVSHQDLLRIEFIWQSEKTQVPVLVRIKEEQPQGPLRFECSHCSEESCAYQWASYVLLWQTLTYEPQDISHEALRQAAENLKAFQMRRDSQEMQGPFAEFASVALDSVSLVLDESALLKGPALSSLLPQDFSKYRSADTKSIKELLSPRLWNLPEIFRKKMVAYSENSFHEVNRQNRMADMVRYNFSNGMQLSAKDVLRHPLQRKVPGHLLPQEKRPVSAFAQWPLLQDRERAFVSYPLQELVDIMQALLEEISTQHRQKKLEVFLQSKNASHKALKLSSIEFDPTQEVDWRVEFTEKRELHGEFKLISFRKSQLAFFESFAVDTSAGVLLVHPWLQEFSQLHELLSLYSEDLQLSLREMPRIDVVGEMECKNLLRYLRTRNIPVKVSGESRVLESHQSLTEIHLQDSGDFFLQHEARVFGQKNLVRRGWTSTAMLYLQTLSQGLPLLLKTDAREIASRSRSKRDWDLKILKHLGVLQYLFLEVLSFHFEGHLTDESVVTREEILPSLQEKIKTLLLTGTESVFAKDLPLSELCSKSVLSCFENFIEMTLKSLSASESFYSEQGEVIMEGVVEREFRLIFTILRQQALLSQGETFKKSRTGLLARITNMDPQDPHIAQGLYHLSPTSAKSGGGLHETLESLQALLPHGFKIFYKDQALQELGDEEFQVDFILRSDADQKYFNWFELNPRFFLRGEEVNPDNFVSFGGGGVVEYEGKLFLVPVKQMPSLRRLENFWRKLQQGKTESSRKKGDDRIYHLPRHQTLELLALRASGVGIRGDEEWKKLCAFYDNLGAQPNEDYQLPATVRAELKPYQKTGVQWLHNLHQLHLGALLADDMGLGKTLQTLSFLETLRTQKKMGQVLIVVPSSLIFNWQYEVEKFTPQLPLTVFSARDRDKIGRKLEHKEETAVIVTYGLLMEHEDFFTQYKWHVLVFDEAQNLKNITTKRTSSARSLAAQFKICLTGTPMENHYGEFFSLVDLLVPGSLGKIEDFRRQFVNTEMVTREQMDDLKLKIKPLLLRRTKKEILDQLPEKQETKVSIAFEDRQREIYRDIALSYNQKVQETMAVQGEASVQLQMLTALLRLRQACSDPAALPNVRYEKTPPKLETLLDSLQEIVESGESALVFTQFLQTLEHTAELLRKADIPVFVLHGGIPTKQRQKILSDFQNLSSGGVLLMTLKTGGVGLNLTKASYVFHLEPWWNPSVENQATDRAHRLGQTKAVQVFRYIMHESLEEKIEVLKERKDKKFQSLFSTTERDPDVNSGSGGSGLTKEDFDLLLGLKSSQTERPR